MQVGTKGHLGTFGNAVNHISAPIALPYAALVAGFDAPVQPEPDKLDVARQALAHSPLGARLLAYLDRAGATFVVLDDATWASQGYPAGVVAATTGSVITLHGRLLDDPMMAALMIGHEATHVFDVAEGVFAPPLPGKSNTGTAVPDDVALRAPGDERAEAARHASLAFARGGFNPREGAIWGAAALGTRWELATEAHAYRNQAIVAHEFGLFDGGSAVTRGMDASGRVFSASEAVAALRADPAYRGVYDERPMATTRTGSGLAADSVVDAERRGGPADTEQRPVTFLGEGGWSATM